MSGSLVALVVMGPPLLAFGMWLTFNAILAKWYGLDALKATPPIYKVFMRREWFGLPPRSDPTASLRSAPSAPQRVGEDAGASQDSLH
jgi:hypothetical protein